MQKNSDIILGVIGLLVFCLGTLLPGSAAQPAIFLVGGIFLTTSSYLSKNIFFTVLEGIVSIGAFFTLIKLSSELSSIITAILVIVTIIYFGKKGMLKDKNLYNGIVGLIFIAIGVVLNMPLALVISGVFLSIYAFIVFFKNGEKIGLIFLILNVIYTLTSLLGYIKTLH